MPTLRFTPGEKETEAARAALKKIEAGGEASLAELPPQLKRLILGLLSSIARKEPVAVIPLEAQLTTKEAADLLGVSRPYLVGLLERGEIPFTRVGTHRRVLLKDLLTYQERTRKEALDALQRQARELGMDYF